MSDQLSVSGFGYGRDKSLTYGGALLVSAYFRSGGLPKVAKKKIRSTPVFPPHLVIGLSDDPRQTSIPITKSVWNN